MSAIVTTTAVASPVAGDSTSSSTSLSPAKTKRSGRARLASFLKASSLPETRNSSPKAALPSTNGTGAGSRTASASQWSAVASSNTRLLSKGPSTAKSKGKNGMIEVVVEESPSGGQRATQPRLPGDVSHDLPVPQTTAELSSQAIPQREPAIAAPAPLRKVTSEGDGRSRVAAAVAAAAATAVEGRSGLQRSASDIDLPDLRTRSDTTSSQASRPSIRSAVSESGLVISSNTVNGNTVLERPKAAAALSKETKVSRRQSITNRLRSRSKPQPINLENNGMLGIAELPKAMLSPRDQVADPMEEQRPSAMSKMTRRTSWIIGSRSPSPSNRKLRRQKSKESRLNAAQLKDTDTSGPKPTLPKSMSATDVSRLNGSDVGKKRRPLSAILTRSNSFAAGSKPNLQMLKSASTDRLPSPHAVDEVPEMPKSIPKAKIQAGPETPRKKDELHTVFRALDADFHKFSSKPSSLKAQVVRSGLLTFLKTTADHPSTKTIRAEDLDKRINVLNKWWVGLLEILNGRNGQSVSPNDRPAILDGVAGIMTRPEWRLSLSTISNRARSRVPVSRSASSLESSSSDFLAESVLHNVRNIFVQNLLSQMAFVIERMSMRSVPASIVSFCGKACAYAFFFCPGVAEILVRLWSPPPDAIRRVMKEAGAMERSHDNAYAVDVLSMNFPAHLLPLAATSLSALMRYLRSKPKDNIPLSSAYIPWNGPWVGRWCGRDSDLFFVFTKTAVALISELLPENISQADWVCVPCAALIQAQLLAVMDATVHRGSSQDHLEGLPPPTFDDVLGADAVVQPIPQRAPNTIRIMAENRLVMLLRECLFSPAFSVKASVRRTFAHIYGNLIKAATRRVSLYDHNACFTLCDFLDETITILGRFYKDEVDPAGWIDWPFWFDVLKKMASSNNTMTEIRLYTFVYGMWGFLTKNDDRKREICLDWLLREEFFDSQFNHWCPMVRAYYMRLLCWRIAREDGEADETNVLIYETLMARLRKCHGWFLYLRESAASVGAVQPVSAPVSPAPGRRLLIVRNDSLPSKHGNASWDNLVAVASSSGQPNAYQRYSSINPLLQAAEANKPSEGAREPSPTAKKGWFRKMNPFASITSTASPAQSAESDADSLASRRSDMHSVDSLSTASKRMSTMSSASSFMSDTNRGRPGLADSPKNRPVATASFKFSLEWADKAALSPRNRRIRAPQLPALAQQLLDAREGSMCSEGDDQSDGAIEQNQTPPLKPQVQDAGVSAYSGRALAEWDMLLKECQGFYERRRVEGVTDVKWMEIPTLGVESFRRPSG